TTAIKRTRPSKLKPLFAVDRGERRSLGIISCVAFIVTSTEITAALTRAVRLTRGRWAAPGGSARASASQPLVDVGLGAQGRAQVLDRAGERLLLQLRADPLLGLVEGQHIAGLVAHHFYHQIALAGLERADGLIDPGGEDSILD